MHALTPRAWPLLLCLAAGGCGGGAATPDDAPPPIEVPLPPGASGGYGQALPSACEGTALALSWRPDGERFAVGGPRGFSEYDARTGARVSRDGSPVRGLAYVKQDLYLLHQGERLLDRLGPIDLPTPARDAGLLTGRFTLPGGKILRGYERGAWADETQLWSEGPLFEVAQGGGRVALLGEESLRVLDATTLEPVWETRWKKPESGFRATRVPDRQRRSVALAPDGSALLLGEKLYALPSGELLRTLPLEGDALDPFHTRPAVVRARFSPDGRRAYLAEMWIGIHAYEVASGKRLGTWRCGSLVRQTPFELSPDGRRLAVGATVQATATPNAKTFAYGVVLDAQTLAPAHLSAPLGHVVGLGFDRGAERLVVAAQDGSLSVYAHPKGELQRRVTWPARGHADGPHLISVSKGQAAFTLGLACRAVGVVDLASGDYREVPLPFFPTNLALDAEARFLAVLGGSTLHLYDLASGKLLSEAKAERGSGDLGFDGDTLWSSSGERWSCADKALAPLPRLPCQPIWVRGKLALQLARRPGEGFNFDLEGWDLESGKALWKTEWAGAASFEASRDGKWFVRVAAHTGAVTVYETRTGRVAQSFTLRDVRRTLSVCFAPDGKSIVTGHSSGHVYAWPLDLE